MDAIGVAGKPRLNDINCKDPLICGLSKHIHTHTQVKTLPDKGILLNMDYLTIVQFCVSGDDAVFSDRHIPSMNPFHQLPQNIHLRCRNRYLWRCGTRRLQVLGVENRWMS